MRRIWFIVLTLVLSSAMVRFPIVKAPTEDIAITSVQYIRTEYLWDPTIYKLLHVKVYIGVTYENVGDETMSFSTLAYGDTLLHESALSDYLNQPAVFPEPTIESSPKVQIQDWGYLVEDGSLTFVPGVSVYLERYIFYSDDYSDGSSDYVAGQWYLFSHLRMFDDNNSNHLPWNSSTPQDGTVGLPPTSVGGIVVPVDKLGLLAPYIGLTSTVIVATITTAIYVKRVKRRKEKQ